MVGDIDIRGRQKFKPFCEQSQMSNIFLPAKGTQTALKMPKTSKTLQNLSARYQKSRTFLQACLRACALCRPLLLSPISSGYQHKVGGSGCAIRGGGGTLKIRSQEAEEEDKFSGSPHKSSVAEGRKNKTTKKKYKESGRTGGKKNITKSKTN